MKINITGTAFYHSVHFLSSSRHLHKYIQMKVYGYHNTSIIHHITVIKHRTRNTTDIRNEFSVFDLTKIKIKFVLAGNFTRPYFSIGHCRVNITAVCCQRLVPVTAAKLH